MTDLVSFGPFELHRQERRLTRNGQIVPLGSRALDVLFVLIDNAGALVSKEQLIASVWPGVHVEDVALRVHINTLRKVLAEGRPQSRDLINVPGRGYQFVTPVHVRVAANISPAETSEAPRPPQDRLPPSAHIIGRNLDIQQIAARLDTERCVTIIGPGGIGKTTVALGIAHRLSTHFPDGAHFVELAPIVDGRHIPGAIAAAMRIPGADGAPLERLAALLRDKKALILLDNCEHLTAEVAEVVAALLATPSPTILATSRERLHVSRESVYRLPTLQVPDETASLAVHEALRYPAIELFVERASASNERFVLDPMNTPIVASICQQLDGVALAIELAASRMDTFGVADIASMLTDRFRVLRRSRRDASRHGSLLAMLDWSYNLLDGELQTFLQEISAFAGRFTLDDAVAMADATEMSKADVVDLLAELVDKSFITADLSGSIAYYRLYETMREYVRHKAQGAGTLGRVRRDHAAYLARLFVRAEREVEQFAAPEWLALYGRYLEDLRLAIDWSIATTNEKERAISLTASASTLWVYRSLLSELQHRCEQALAELGPDATNGTAREMTLFASLSYAMVNLYGPTPQGTQACRAALEIARKIGDDSSQVKSLLALWNGCFANGEVRQSLSLAQEFMNVAGKLGHADVLVAHRMLGSSHFYLGDVRQARRHMEIMVSDYSATHHEAHLARFGFGQLASGRGLLAFYLRYQGQFDAAMEATRRSVQEAVDSKHAMTICGVLGTTSVSNSIAIGHYDEAQRYVDILANSARTHGLRRWENFAIGFEAIIDARRGKIDEALQKLSRVIEQADDRANTRYMLLFSEYALVLGEVGDPAAGLEVINQTLERLSGTGETWYEPELFRCRAVLSAKCGLEDEKVETLFQLALARAEELDALAVRLQTAKGLARHLHERGRTREGFEILKYVHGLFTEGHDTPELLHSGELLESLAGSVRPRLVHSAKS